MNGSSTIVRFFEKRWSRYCSWKFGVQISAYLRFSHLPYLKLKGQYLIKINAILVLDRLDTAGLKYSIGSNWHRQGCGAVTFLVGSGSGSGSGEAFRLRLPVKLFGGSGSGSGSGQNVPAPAAPAPAPAPAPMLKSSYEPYLTSNTIFKNVKYQNMTFYWLDLEFECYFEWVPLKFVTHCHPRSVADTGEVTNSLGLRCQR